MRFIALLNQDVLLGKTLNALAHMAIGLGTKLDLAKGLPAIEIYFSTEQQVRQLVNNMRKFKFQIVSDFTNTMTEETAAEQLVRSRLTSEKDLTYFAAASIVDDSQYKQISYLLARCNIIDGYTRAGAMDMTQVMRAPSLAQVGKIHNAKLMMIIKKNASVAALLNPLVATCLEVGCKSNPVSLALNDFIDADNNHHSGISEHNFPILSAQSAAKLENINVNLRQHPELIGAIRLGEITFVKGAKKGATQAEPLVTTIFGALEQIELVVQRKDTSLYKMELDTTLLRTAKDWFPDLDPLAEPVTERASDPEFPGFIQGEHLDYPTNDQGQIITVLQHIYQQCQLTPQKVALTYHDEHLTYGELFKAIYFLSAKLKAQNVQPNDQVAVYGHRNIDYCISLLAIFNVGALYIPLDPIQIIANLERVTKNFPHLHMIASGDLTVQQLEKLSYLNTNPIVFTIKQLANAELPSQESVVAQARGPLQYEAGLSKVTTNEMETLRYAVPTSGTSGLPKFPLVHERSMLLQQLAKIAVTHLSNNDVVTQSASQTFDVHLWQILAPLMVGATVAVVDRCEADAPKILLDKISRQKITVLELVPNMLRVLLEELEQTTDKSIVMAQLASLKVLAVTGDALPRSYCERWYNFFIQSGVNAPQIINMYGPNECGDDVGQFPVTHPESMGNEIIPILAKPIANVTIYLIKEDGSLAKEGEEAILFISGDAVGKGYYGDAEKTAAAFHSIVVNGQPILGYNTSDRVRYSEGKIHYLGRTNFAGFLKIAGQRVELESFTHSLYKNSFVSNALALKHPDIERVVCFTIVTVAHLQEIKKRIHAERSQAIGEIFDDAISDQDSAVEFNHGGWNNYLPGVKFSDRAVRENLDDALAHLQNVMQANHDVLEIGCGSGMLAFQLADRCAHYTGTDISASSIQWAKKACLGKSNTDFIVCDAGECATKLDDRRYNVIFFNAVVNYFADPEKLTDVLQQASTLLKPDGKILILDVYHLQCQELLHAEFELLKLKKSDLSRTNNHTIGDLRAKRQLAVFRDPDLQLSPGYFKKFVESHPALRSVQCFLKSGAAQDNGLINPMTCFRYSVILDTQEKPVLPQEVFSLEGKNISSLRMLLELISQSSASIIHLRNILSVRIAKSQRLNNLINELPFDASIACLGTQLTNRLLDTAIDPDTLHQELAAIGFGVHQKMFGEDVSRFDAIIVRAGTPCIYSLAITNQTKKLANSPIAELALTRLSQELTEQMQQQPYGSYCSVRVLPEFPTTHNGKVDINSLLQSMTNVVVSFDNFFTDAQSPRELELVTLLKPLLIQHLAPLLALSDNTVQSSSIEATFLKLGLTSINLIDIIAKLNRQYETIGLNLNLAQDGQDLSIKVVANKIDELTAQLTFAM